MHPTERSVLMHCRLKVARLTALVYGDMSPYGKRVSGINFGVPLQIRKDFLLANSTHRRAEQWRTLVHLLAVVVEAWDSANKGACSLGWLPGSWWIGLRQLSGRWSSKTSLESVSLHPDCSAMICLLLRIRKRIDCTARWEYRVMRSPTFWQVRSSSGTGLCVGFGTPHCIYRRNVPWRGTFLILPLSAAGAHHCCRCRMTAESPSQIRVLGLTEKQPDHIFVLAGADPVWMYSRSSRVGHRPPHRDAYSAWKFGEVYHGQLLEVQSADAAQTSSLGQARHGCFDAVHQNQVFERGLQVNPALLLKVGGPAIGLYMVNPVLPSDLALHFQSLGFHVANELFQVLMGFTMLFVGIALRMDGFSLIESSAGGAALSTLAIGVVDVGWARRDMEDLVPRSESASQLLACTGTVGSFIALMVL